MVKVWLGLGKTYCAIFGREDSRSLRLPFSHSVWHISFLTYVNAQCVYAEMKPFLIKEYMCMHSSCTKNLFNLYSIFYLVILKNLISICLFSICGSSQPLTAMPISPRLSQVERRAETMGLYSRK